MKLFVVTFETLKVLTQTVSVPVVREASVMAQSSDQAVEKVLLADPMITKILYAIWV